MENKITYTSGKERVAALNKKREELEHQVESMLEIALESKKELYKCAARSIMNRINPVYWEEVMDKVILAVESCSFDEIRSIEWTCNSMAKHDFNDLNKHSYVDCKAMREAEREEMAKNPRTGRSRRRRDGQ